MSQRTSNLYDYEKDEDLEHDDARGNDDAPHYGLQ